MARFHCAFCSVTREVPKDLVPGSPEHKATSLAHMVTCSNHPAYKMLQLLRAVREQSKSTHGRADLQLPRDVFDQIAIFLKEEPLGN